MAIKNYSADIAINEIFSELQETLGKHGAKQISFDYDNDGRIQSVQFVIKANVRFIPVRLPARVAKAQAVLKRQWEAGIILDLFSLLGTFSKLHFLCWRTFKFPGFEPKVSNVREIYNLLKFRSK